VRKAPENEFPGYAFKLNRIDKIEWKPPLGLDADRHSTRGVKTASLVMESRLKPTRKF